MYSQTYGIGHVGFTHFKPSTLGCATPPLLAHGFQLGLDMNEIRLGVKYSSATAAYFPSLALCF